MTAATNLPLCHRLVVRGELHVPRAFHIGRGSASLLSDIALRRNGDGQPYIPGSSLAGLLRSAAESLAPYTVGKEPCEGRDTPCVICDLFGWAPRQAERGAGRASRIYVEDALPITAAPDVVEIREHVGMDRRQGTARAQLQYNREVAPGDMRFSFELTVEEPVADDVHLLLAVLDEWSDPDIGLRLGGRTSAGLGYARLELGDKPFYALDFDDDALLLAYLQTPIEEDELSRLPDAANLGRQELLQRAGAAVDPLSVKRLERYLPQRLMLDLVLETVEPLLVVGYIPKLITADGKGSDAEPVTAMFMKVSGETREQVFLPGSSLKGVLRSRAEMIVRTLNYYRGYESSVAAHVDPSAAEDAYRTRIAACAITHKIPDKEPPEGKAYPEPERVYGCFGGRYMNTAEDAEESAVYDASCVTCRLFGNTALAGRLVVGDGIWEGETEPAMKLFDHVAIDRFSGGAADARKFDTYPLLPGSQFKVRLELTRPEPWMFGLLALLIKDLQDEDIWVGHATHRGYGRVKARVDHASLWTIAGSELDAKAQKHGLPLAADGHRPYRRYALDVAAWPPGTAEKANSTRKLLQEAFAEFQALVEALEQQKLGRVLAEEG